jgi:uncharacterized membrane protein YedE/YeeE
MTPLVSWVARGFLIVTGVAVLALTVMWRRFRYTVSFDPINLGRAAGVLIAGGILCILWGLWPAAGFKDTELGVFMEPEVEHGATEVYARVQA